MAVILLTRFWGIDSNPLWPIKDVGHFGILGLALSHQWDWRLLWGECQSEPLYLWILALFYKLVGPSSLTTRLFPAILSILTLGTAYWAARQFFSKSLSAIVTCFFAAGFANWVFSRTGIGPIALWPLEFLAFGLLGKALEAEPPPGVFLFLGATTGMGFYSYASWPVVFLSISLALLYKILRRPRHASFFFLYLVSSAMIALPMALAHMEKVGLQHFQGEFLQFPLLKALPGYLNLLFWDGAGSQPDGPAWGGIINPIEGALVSLGFLRLVTQGGGWAKWVFTSFGLFLLPGILSNIVGMCHVIQETPLLLIPLVAGLEDLILHLKKPQRWSAVAVLLLISMALNAYHWWGPYQDWKSLPLQKSDWISGEYARAYSLLNGVQEQAGPGYLFTEFKLDSFDKTLELFCYPFDALQNPKWGEVSPRWAAFLVNKYYVPFLQKRFSQSRWDVLKKDPLPNNLNLALGVMPLDSSSREDWERWEAADRFCRDLDMERKRAGPSVGEAVFQDELKDGSALFSGDPFLQSIYWEKMAMSDAVRGDNPACEKDYQNAIQQGYPAAHLFYNLSVVERMDGKTRQAGQDFQRAAQIRKDFLLRFSPGSGN